MIAVAVGVGVAAVKATQREKEERGRKTAARDRPKRNTPQAKLANGGKCNSTVFFFRYHAAYAHF